jgi:hypothetical protein
MNICLLDFIFYFDLDPQDMLLWRMLQDFTRDVMPLLQDMTRVMQSSSHPVT